jgi:hypothetical protein
MAMAATQHIAFRLPEPLVRELKAEAERTGATRTDIAREALEVRLRRAAEADAEQIVSEPPKPTSDVQALADREMADRLDAAMRSPGTTRQLARRDEAHKLGISDAEAVALLAKRARGEL